MKTKKSAINGNKEAILNAVKNKRSHENILLRQMTSREYLRFMGVDDKYIDRMTKPREELTRIGYTHDEIDKLMTVDGKQVKVRDNDLCKQAGNSIVVDVLYHVFKQLLIPNR